MLLDHLPIQYLKISLMLTLSRFFTLATLTLLFGISSVSAFSVLDLSRNPEVATRYQTLKDTYEARYQTLYPLKEAEMRSIEKIE